MGVTGGLSASAGLPPAKTGRQASRGTRKASRDGALDPSEKMDESTFHKLEFDAIRDLLAGYCATDLGKSLAATLKPSPSSHQVQTWLRQAQEMSNVTEKHGLPPLGGVHDVRELVKASAFPTPLEANELVKIADTLSATAGLRRWFGAIEGLAPTLASLDRRVPDLTAIAGVISEAIDERCEIRDEASRKLGDLRGAIADARRHLRLVFDRIIKHAGQSGILQYGSATFHNDRYVLPLKAEYRGRVQGIVHRSSDSGATLFVEPAESVELNNTIVRLRDEESKEITRILKALTGRINSDAPQILETLQALSLLDMIAAKCRYMKKRSCICPVIDEDGVLELHAARHPLLVEIFAEEQEAGKPPREVVPIDVRLGDDFDVLMVTGPNTGGKTVSLKTVGLLALMTQCGIPIPAGQGSRLPVYRRIFIDIGDEQSLQQSLSTFSSHLKTLQDILRRSGDRTLVLIDELGAGTDPDEGAAIGQAIVEELLTLGAKAIVTTHLGVLKAVAFTNPRVDNACVEFDSRSLRPTFVLKLGEPGNSNALIIAKRLGLPARLIQRAKSFLDDRTRALNKAIAGTLDSRRQAEQARRDARDAAIASRRELDLLEKDRVLLLERQEAFEAWTKWIHQLTAGDEVFVKSLNSLAKVVRMQLHKQTALVSAGAMDIDVSIRELTQPGDNNGR